MTYTIRTFKVGGVVRDMFLNVKSKDIDYAVEVSGTSDVPTGFSIMRDYIKSMGGVIFLETPEHVTIRARVGDEAADYVLCRRDGSYSDGRRPDEVFVGTIDDDLARRDFTMNAIAVMEDGSIYDPFGGQYDIEQKFIRCVGRTADRMREDSLRLVRAARFSITKGFRIHSEISEMFDSATWMERLSMISEDRIRDEVEKMFRFDTIRTIAFFGCYPFFAEACFGGGKKIWMKPTSEKK